MPRRNDAPNAGDLEELYKDVHRHPELSMQERRTAGLAVERLSAAGFV
jgi:metal-dependent amidase/aminoacylase/carboxypeptidase family protein